MFASAMRHSGLLGRFMGVARAQRAALMLAFVTAYVAGLQRASTAASGDHFGSAGANI